MFVKLSSTRQSNLTIADRTDDNEIINDSKKDMTWKWGPGMENSLGFQLLEEHAKVDELSQKMTEKTWNKLVAFTKQDLSVWWSHRLLVEYRH